MGTEAPDYYSFSFNLSLPPTFQVLSNALYRKYFATTLASDVVVDANNYTDDIQVAAAIWINGPISNAISILIVSKHSVDWIMQRFYALTYNGLIQEYQRAFIGGNTWTDWRAVAYTS